MRMAVVGGTGTVGRHVVDVARERGHDVAVLARSTGVDVSTGAGLDAALAGIDVVVDVTNSSGMSAAAAVASFGDSTRRLLEAEQRAGVAHHVLLSIVGIDRHGAAPGYYAGKAAQERAVGAGAIPWTILRATQFHEFAAQSLARGRRGPVVLVPSMRSQPIAAREVAERLVALAEREPAGRVADLGGPRIERMSELVRLWARATAVSARVVEVPLPGAFGRLLRDGSLRTDPDADLGRRSFDEWLREETGVSLPERRVVPAKTGLDLLFTATKGGGQGGLAAFLAPRERGPRLPEPSLTNAEPFVQQLQDSGMRIALVVDGGPRRLPIDVDQTAFRVIQEGVSIILMRVRGTEATVRIRYLPEAVEVSVEHAPDAESPTADRSSGLRRTRRAIQSLGGTAEAAVTPGGGYRVSAVLPG